MKVAFFSKNIRNIFVHCLATFGWNIHIQVEPTTKFEDWLPVTVTNQILQQIWKLYSDVLYVLRLGSTKVHANSCQKNKSSIVIYHANVLYFWASTLSKKAISNQKQGLIQGTIEESVRTPRAFGNVVVFALLCFGKKRKQLREKMLHRRNIKGYQI